MDIYPLADNVTLSDWLLVSELAEKWMLELSRFFCSKLFEALAIEATGLLFVSWQGTRRRAGIWIFLCGSTAAWISPSGTFGSSCCSFPLYPSFRPSESALSRQDQWCFRWRLLLQHRAFYRVIRQSYFPLGWFGKKWVGSRILLRSSYMNCGDNPDFALLDRSMCIERGSWRPF